LERIFKGSEQEHLLNKMFGGTQLQELIYTVGGQERRSTQVSPFMTLSLDIQKNDTTLHQAMQNYFAGETIKDYKTDEGLLTEVLRRPSIKNLPNTLIIHLKRFKWEWHSGAGKKEKIYDYLSFPFELNVHSYTVDAVHTKEGSSLINTVDPSQCQYDLTGVVVHSGTAEGGHYYSFIKERTEVAEKAKWFKFDDSRVTPFDITNLGDECFGGEEALVRGVTSHKKKNVYMLFYERRDTNKRSIKPLLDQLHASVPADLLERIRKSNADLLQGQLLNEPIYFDFLVDLFAGSMQHEPLLSMCKVLVKKCSEDDERFTMIKMATKFFSDVVICGKNDISILQYIEFLHGLYAQHVPACKWFLYKISTTHDHWVKYLLVECPKTAIRDHFASLLIQMLTTLSPEEANIFPPPADECVFLAKMADRKNLLNGESPFYFSEVEMEEMKAKGPELLQAIEKERHKKMAQRITQQALNFDELQHQCVSVIFMRYMLDIMEYTRKHWKQFHSYFRVIKEFSSIGHVQRAYMLSQRIIELLIDYYMGRYSPYHENNKLSTRCGIRDENTQPDLTYLFDTIGIVIRGCHTGATVDMLLQGGKIQRGSMMLESKPNDAYEEVLAPLEPMERYLLKEKHMFTSLTKQGFNVNVNIRIITHLSWEDQDYTYWILGILMTNFYKYRDKAIMQNQFHCISGLLKIDDSLSCWRTYLVLNWTDGMLAFVSKDYSNSYRASALEVPELVLTVLFSEISKNPRVAAYLYDEKSHYRDNFMSILRLLVKTAVRVASGTTDSEFVVRSTALLSGWESFWKGDMVVEKKWDGHFDLNAFKYKEGITLGNKR